MHKIYHSFLFKLLVRWPLAVLIACVLTIVILIALLIDVTNLVLWRRDTENTHDVLELIADIMERSGPRDFYDNGRYERKLPDVIAKKTKPNQQAIALTNTVYEKPKPDVDPETILPPPKPKQYSNKNPKRWEFQDTSTPIQKQ